MALVRSAARAITVDRGLDVRTVDEILGELPGSAESLERNKPPAVLRPEDLGALFESRTAQRRRKGQGMFYTARELVTPTVRRALGPLLDGDAPLSVCDPAAGGGAFLLAALDIIADARGGDRRAALDCVVGVDLDPGAVRVARLAMWLAVADDTLDPCVLERQIRRGDACVGAWPGAHDAAPDAFCAEWFGDGEVDAFHWPVEFPAEFARGGFDAVIGNPPWEIRKPNSRTFFSAVDPAYAGATKQDALRIQRRLLVDDPELAARWARENARHAAFGRWMREARSPFERQGRGDANQYKLFTELAWHLLRDGGRLGLVLPSGIYTDAGCADLRRMLAHETRWEWLFGFENRRRVFPIDARFKFAVVVAEKGPPADAVRTAFMRVDLADWAEPESHATTLSFASIALLSPRSLAIPELDGARSIATLERIHANAHPFAVELETSIRYRRELDLTQQSHRFPPRREWESHGFRPDAFSRWLRVRRTTARATPDSVPLRDGTFVRQADVLEVALPLYEGRMIGQFDFAEKGWVRGRGRNAEWREIPFSAKQVEPQYLLPASELAAVDSDWRRPKIGFMAIGSATNRRSMIAASLLHAPCGNSVPVLRSDSLRDDLCVLAVLDSFVFDYALRIRLGGLNLNQFVLAETPMLLPGRRATIRDAIVPHVAALSWPSARFAPAWLALDAGPPQFALDPGDRLRRRCLLDAVIAAAYGLAADDFDWILRDCGHAGADLRSLATTAPFDRKGFWRIDRDRPPEQRHTELTRAAFRDLSARIQSAGSLAAAVTTFCSDSGWRLPTATGARESAEFSADECVRTAALLESTIGGATATVRRAIRTPFAERKTP